MICQLSNKTLMLNTFLERNKVYVDSIKGKLYVLQKFI
jgi:hypothetical protein